MTDEQRAEYATHLRRTRTVAVVDEAHQALALEGQEMPRPFAAYAPDTITIGSASKSFWGGLRLGWLRAPHARMDALTQARLGLDLGAPVLEQLVLTRLLAAPDAIAGRAPGPAPRAARRAGRGGRAGAARVAVPSCRAAGSALWCQLPAPAATAVVAEAEARGVIVAPGPVFAAEGGLDHFVRIPWTRPVDELEDAVARLAAAWAPSGRAVPAPQHPAHPGRLTGRLTGCVRLGSTLARPAVVRSGSGQVGGADALGVDGGLDLGEGLGRDRRVDRERDQGLAALGVAGDLHAGDVDAGVAEDPADGADHARDGPRSGRTPGARSARCRRRSR